MARNPSQPGRGSYLGYLTWPRTPDQQRGPGDPMTSTLPHRLPRQRHTARWTLTAATTPYLELDVPAAVAPVRRPRVGPARHGRALRREGQPAPAAARRAGRRRVPLRRRQPGRGPRRARRRRDARRARLLQPGQAARPRRRGSGTRRAALRRGLPERGREGRRGRTRQRGALPAGDLRRGLRLAAVAQVRLLHLRGRRGAHPRRPARARRGRCLLPRRVPAARPRGLGQADRRRRPTSSTCSARAGCAPGSSTWAAGFPASHEDGCRPVSAYGEAIERHLEPAPSAPTVPRR